MENYPFERLGIAYMMAVFENGFYSECMASIKRRTCVSGTRATRLRSPVLASDSGSNKNELCGSLPSSPRPASSSHLTSSLVLTGDMPFLFQRVLIISFLICWHLSWAIVVGEWREGVVSFKTMRHCRVFGTLGD